MKNRFLGPISTAFIYSHAADSKTQSNHKNFKDALETIFPHREFVINMPADTENVIPHAQEIKTLLNFDFKIDRNRPVFYRADNPNESKGYYVSGFTEKDLQVLHS